MRDLWNGLELRNEFNIRLNISIKIQIKLPNEILKWYSHMNLNILFCKLILNLKRCEQMSQVCKKQILFFHYTNPNLNLQIIYILIFEGKNLLIHYTYVSPETVQWFQKHNFQRTFYFEIILEIIVYLRVIVDYAS